MILFTMIAIGVPSYFSGRKAVHDLWHDLAKQIGASTTEVSQRFLSTAEPIAAILNNQVLEGELDINNASEILDQTRSVLKAYPSFTWVAFASIKGDYIASYRLPNDYAVHGTIRTIESYDKANIAQTKDEEFLWRSDEKWILTDTLFNNYDPRTRPFWHEGIHKKDGSWSHPFVDWQTKRPSFAYTRPQYNANKELLGLWEIEFRADYLSDFLARIQIGKSGQVWILTEDGMIIASSTPHDLSILSVYDLKTNNLLLQAWRALGVHEDSGTELSFGHYFAYITPLQSLTGIPWKIVTIVPKSDFLGPIERDTWITAIIGLSLALFFCFCGILFFGHISTQLNDVAHEMTELGALNISDKNFAHKETFVKEVNMMNTAVDLLKIGFSSFAKYVPIDLVHSLIRSGQPAHLEGHKNEMTVLFSDITRFTDLTEQLPPARLLEILRDYFTEMSHVIQENHGQVDKFIGDAIMAFWNAPDPFEDHAKAACLTALLMRKRLTETMPYLSQRIGINTGSMIVGNIGSPSRMQYTVVGDAVNLASRLEGLSKFYGTHILVGEETARQAGANFVFRPLDWVFVKGRIQTSLIYELIGLRESCPETILKAVDHYEQALYLYRNHEFMKASQKFEEAYELFNNDDKPSALMAERARQYVLSPPQDDWAGVTLMSEK